MMRGTAQGVDARMLLLNQHDTIHYCCNITAAAVVDYVRLYVHGCILTSWLVPDSCGPLVGTRVKRGNMTFLLSAVCGSSPTRRTSTIYCTTTYSTLYTVVVVLLLQ